MGGSISVASCVGLLPSGLLSSIVSVVLWYFAVYLRSPLRKFPGPFLADLDIPELVKTIYNTKGNWKKTEFYHGSSAKVDAKIIYNLFSQTDPVAHAREKRPIAKYYSMNGVLSLEPHIDKMIGYLCKKLEEEFIDKPEAEKSCDLGQWLLFYTWDVVGNATFSQSIGYLENGYDFDNTIAISDKAMEYFSLVGQYPILGRLLDKNPVYRIGPPGFGNITNICVQHLIDRLQGNDAAHHDPSRPRFLDRFIEAKSTNGDFVNDGQIISYLMINMIAGADTTAVTPRAEELPVQQPKSSPISFKHAYGLSYLNAVVREVMRLHPSVTMILERYVPQGGLSLPGGGFIQQGYITGMNPDTERETEDEFQQRLTLMNNCDLVFGAGSRVYIGKNLALLEVYKVVGTLISRYDVELVYPDQEWKTHNSFFLGQEGVEVKLSRRWK
ncbi:hypothetical protein EYB26_005047 [Talaromyces marneffei]|nr:uncharacterized protein EYB26_005047 [Talaromyces marneffei]QGA17376.1 hypothetical protein EYB26_005047 [Talaromyces marneffei]